MAFYVGCYLISGDTIDLKHDSFSWAFPADSDQHMADTSNVEELLIFPSDMDVLPQQIQFGSETYTDDEGFVPDHGAFAQFYVRDENFYVRGFTAGTELYTQFYVKTQEQFYVRGFTPASELYTQFYVKTQEQFYVRGFTAGSDLYTQFYVKTQEQFYVRGFTATDFFYSIAEDDCG